MIQLRTVCLSAHLDSFCRKLNELRGLEFVYSDADPGEERRRVGWRTVADYPNGPSTAENIKRAADCELLFEMLRELDLMETRIAKGRKTVYASERWFKSIRIGDEKKRRWKAAFPGVMRLLVPGYRRMAQRFVKLMDDPNFYVFAIGVPAVRDFVRMYRIFHGDWRCWFRSPDVKIERKLGGAVEGFPRMKLWAYFVDQGSGMEKVERRGGGGQRTLAQRKVEEWLAGVTRETFDAALLRLVDEKVLANEYKFKRVGDRELALAGARRFFAEFSRKIVQLSDGRYVYFVPDARSKARNGSDLSQCWAEYAFHAVSNGGAKIPGKGYNERWYNSHKAVNLNQIVETLRSERCFVRLRKEACVDSILFAGLPLSGMAFDVVTRLDEFGNVEANLTEVTFEATTRSEKKLPRLVPLVEAVQTVVHHQTTAGSYPQDNNIISKSCSLRNGDGILRILWIGRMLDWKRVDTLIKAFRRVAKKRSAALLLVGEGPERKSLEKLAGKDRVVAENPEWQEGKIVFHDYVKNDVVRELMRCADVDVMPSNGEEGWGAAVSEALSEGCPVISTYEAGSSATLLPDANLFPAGRVAELVARLLRFKGEMVKYSAEEWGGETAVERLLEIMK